VLSAAQADALSAKGDRVLGLIGLVGVGAHEQLALRVGPLHELGIEGVSRRLLGRQRLLDEHLQHLAGARLELT